MVHIDEWTARPIAAGNAHDRLIERARLVSVNKTIHKHFVHKNLAQFAFGVEGGSTAVVTAQIAHESLNPTHVTDCCDGSNAYNVARREIIAEGILTSKVSKLREGYGYYLMGHRVPTKIYIKGTRKPITTSDTGVRQGNPSAGMYYCIAQTDMLFAMTKELKENASPTPFKVRIASIVDDISMQGEINHVAKCHQWLKTNGESWGYLLNEDYGKTTVIPGPQTRNLMGGGTKNKQKDTRLPKRPRLP